jgi:lipoyl-dependent peroxiredoxin
MAMRSTASTRWEGDLFNGKGVTSLATGAAGPLPVNWKARSEGEESTTTPEELIAAAHASCFSMAFSGALAKNETPPTTLEVEATATFVPGTGITTMELSVVGTVDGISEDRFLELAELAKDNCPVSKALAGNVEMTLSASLG